MESFPIFLLAAIGLLMTPGPTNTMLFTVGALRGSGRPTPLLFGELAGYTLSIACIALFLYPVLSPSPSAMKWVNLACAVFLFYAAVKLILWRGNAQPDDARIGALDLFLTTLTNPKGAIFALYILPPMTVGRVLGLGILIIMIGSFWYFLGSVVKSKSRAFLSSTAVRRCGGAIILFYSIMLLSLSTK